MPYRPVEAVSVELWGKKVGAVALDPDSGFYAFEYEPGFARSGIELSPLQMPLAQASEPFVFPTLASETYQRLPALLADALPDRFGNSLVNAYLVEQGLSERSITPLDRLAYMGQRSMGAMIFKPNRGPGKSRPTALDMAELVRQARSVIAGDFAADDHAGSVLRQIIQVGTSAGGARAKAAIAWNAATGEVKTGPYDIPDGFDAWLLKFDGLGADPQMGAGAHFGRVEYVYSQMAKAAGIDMSDCHLLEEGGRAHFMTRRFDREGDVRHHMQTLCAMAHLDFNQIGAHSYGQLFETIVRLDLGRAALEQALRRMVFNQLCANHDDHTKNQSFLLRQGAAWELAPAYDITFAYDRDNRWLRQHLMSVNGKFSAVTARDVRQVADRYGLLGLVNEAIAQASHALASWAELARDAGVPQAQNEHIARIIEELRLAF